MPDSLTPSREQQGEVLLEMNGPLEALQAFDASMRVELDRFHGLADAARAGRG